MNTPTLVWDIEIYVDYFLIAFRNIATGNVRHFEIYDDQALSAEDIKTLKLILKRHTIVGFNSHGFDLPILSLALTGATCSTIKKAANAIIVNNTRAWRLEQMFRFQTIRWADSIDLIVVAPGMASLKIYGGRMHCAKMQDLPIAPEANIAPEQRAELRSYCENDLYVTEMLYRKLLPQIELREAMSAEYGIDLRSKSDAQIAEAVINSEVEKITGQAVVRPEVETGTRVYYKAPPYLHFTTPELQDVVKRLKDDPFVVADSGKLIMPEWLEWLEKQRIKLGGTTYKMGIGGLHSQEKSVAFFSSETHVLKAPDVASYYPNIILTLGLAPTHMGAAFTKVYRGIVERRLAAKASGDKVTNEVLKIVVNGSFGKLGSKWSTLYSPELLTQVTMTGQLALLMLIEQLEAHGIAVVSANTDGIVAHCPRELIGQYDRILADWENVTGFNTECEDYAATYSRDVNNYVGIKTDGKVKTRGVYATGNLAKTPSNNICVEAVVQYLRDGTPVEDTIHGCWDVSKFVTVRSVKGGALDQTGRYLGKAVRFYKATGIEGQLTYQINGYAVPRTEGAKALMELTDAVPEDLDIDWYVAEAKQILNDVGATC